MNFPRLFATLVDRSVESVHTCITVPALTNRNNILVSISLTDTFKLFHHHDVSSARHSQNACFILSALINRVVK